MNLHDQPRAVVDGVAIIVDAGAVRRAHFAQDCARAGHDVRDAEAVANLDQLAARDDDFASGRELIQDRKTAAALLLTTIPGGR